MFKYFFRLIDEMRSKSDVEGKRYSNWIDILLDTPVSDGRHRIITYILAPYLINVRNLDTSKAIKILEDWVARCNSYKPMGGNFKAFVRHACYNAYKFKHEPKDLKYFSKNYKKLYRMISSIIDPQDLISDKTIQSSSKQ